MSHRDFIAMQAMMKYEPVANYDSGEDGIFPECRSCRFHRPYAQDRTCVLSKMAIRPASDSATFCIILNF